MAVVAYAQRCRQRYADTPYALLRDTRAHMYTRLCRRRLMMPMVRAERIRLYVYSGDALMPRRCFADTLRAALRAGYATALMI